MEKIDNLTTPKNITSQEKVSKKFSFIKIVIPLVLLLILGGLGFVFRDRIFNSNVEKDGSTVVSNPEFVDDYSAFYSYFSQEDSYLYLKLDYEYLKEKHSEEEINLLVPENPEFPYLYLSSTVDNLGADLQLKMIFLQPIFLEALEYDSKFFIKVAIRDENNRPGALDIFVGDVGGYNLLNFFTLIDHDENITEVDISKLPDVFEKGNQIQAILLRNIPFGLEPFESSELHFCEGIEHLCQMIQTVVDSGDYDSLIPAIILDRNLKQE